MVGFSKKWRVISMIVLTSIYFFIELIVGRLKESLALVADSFHMLSDVLALFVALYAINLKHSKNHSSNQTFGFERAEVLGAFANSVFLLALCFTIFLDAIARFFEVTGLFFFCPWLWLNVDPIEVKDPLQVLVVGSIGLLINLIGLCIFGG
eukprot:Pompholyxophrys_punicea_v1_NODE_1577_length_639_cov_2.294521.p1 type:complete len:152 gc:universal NODE_1577_length_639_cov_2.294521:468-13(-)